MGLKNYVLHTGKEILDSYTEIIHDEEKYAYFKKILAHIESMEELQWFDIYKNVSSKNIPEFIKCVCVLYQYKLINISFSNDFIKFKKYKLI